MLSVHPASYVHLKQNKIFYALVLGIMVMAQFRAQFRLQQSFGREAAALSRQEGAPELIATKQKRNLTNETIIMKPFPHLVVDILSIGSQRRPKLLTVQQETFGSHISVRHFFNATEADDDDPHCNSNLTPEDTYEISKHCKQRHWDQETHTLMRFLKNSYANMAWLRKKANPVGWMCAQRRPMHGLYKVFQRYKGTGELLPDYLILMDDDTYFNLEQFQRLMKEEKTINPEDPSVFAGCLVRLPVQAVNFTFGFGGYGTIFNQASLKRLLEPIHCSPNGTETNNEDACVQVGRNQIGEQKVFQSGMSVLELIKAFVDYQPYKDQKVGNWTDGYCMHSDWLLGFFVNHYNISSHVHNNGNDYYKDVPHARMEVWHNSVIYRKGTGFCKNGNVKRCEPGSVTCHYMTPEAMTNYTNIVKAKSPLGRFRDVQARVAAPG